MNVAWVLVGHVAVVGNNKKTHSSFRTITCASGWVATQPSAASILLKGDAAFQGCTEMNECNVYSYSGKAEFVKSCVDGLNKRYAGANSDFFKTFKTKISIYIFLKK